MIVDICSEGDTLLVVQGIAGVSQSVGIRVSSSALAIASPVFRRILVPSSSLAPPTPSPGTEEQREPRPIHLANDDGDALFLLLNILHLRNDALPARIQPDLLLRFVATCARYECIVAAGRAASQWLDYIYTKLTKGNKTSARINNHTSSSIAPTPASAAPPATPFSATPPPTDTQTLFNLVEATLLLNDALFFTRFTNHFILTQPLLTSPTTLPLTSPTQQTLFTALRNRQIQSLHDLRLDFDLLIEPLAECLSEDTKHYIDCPPGEDPDPSTMLQIPGSGTRPYTSCTVDVSTSTTLLSSLRDANLWPATRWPLLLNNPTDPRSPQKSQTGNLVAALERFRVPDVDASDACFWCTRVEDRFATTLGLLRMMHKDRMWGLCLDCYKTGGAVNAAGECRVEHFKAAGTGGLARLGAPAGGAAQMPSSSNLVVLGNNQSGGQVLTGGEV
ncbi:hypothetical protein CERZMDRAFT_49995 [Cercospora zeae-maydis SCOH1-5]|uniref:BTB domain-containing protein n=1 Tax=Cercospora zeae-maydis SCOH1-5 TaxID=717836 RepID=A0A6A6F3K4_9PEZI|nr:hypothetical protein CERZMDRAFT_49995 [Cercospora zeae-maydis SCOH1-5]